MRLDITAIVTDLYDPLKPGALAVPDILDTEFRKQLLDEIKLLHYDESPRHYGHADQEVSHCVVRDTSRLPLIHSLNNQYSEVYERIAEQAGFTSDLNSLIVHKFCKGAMGIGPHRDESKYRNLISVFVIDGEAPFYVCSGREKTDSGIVALNPVKLDASPGSLILLRAPRNIGEKALRPMHYVGDVTKERYTIGLRTIHTVN